MKITCDSESSMGYITLKPSTEESTCFESQNALLRHISAERNQIPYIVDEKLSSHLDQMVVAANTFKVDYEKGYDTEYGNDMDEEGLYHWDRTNPYPRKV